MSDVPDPGESPPNVTQLVDALNHMRDTLVQVSLLLQDYRFEVEDEQRQEAVEAVNNLLSKSGNVSRKV